MNKTEVYVYACALVQILVHSPQSSLYTYTCWNPPSLRSQAFLSLDAAISLPLARFMIENRRAPRQKHKNASSDLEMGVASNFSRARSPLQEFLDPPLSCTHFGTLYSLYTETVNINVCVGKSYSNAMYELLLTIVFYMHQPMSWLVVLKLK